MTKTSIALAILARKAELGKGKTRLAKGIGKQQAFAAYKHLIEITASVTSASGLPSTVFFDPEVADTHVWPSAIFDYDRSHMVFSSLNIFVAFYSADQRILK